MFGEDIYCLGSTIIVWEEQLLFGKDNYCLGNNYCLGRTIIVLE